MYFNLKEKELSDKLSLNLGNTLKLNEVSEFGVCTACSEKSNVL